MGVLMRPWIKLLGSLDQLVYDEISKLAQICTTQDGTSLKLELDYKLSAASGQGLTGAVKEINEFLYYDGEQLIGYIGIGSFGGAGSPPEVMGMVHPSYRRQGIFTMLNSLALAELTRRGCHSALLLCDAASEAGRRLVQSIGAVKHHTEFEMYLKGNSSSDKGWIETGLVLKKASNSDAYEVARQNAIYFGDEFSAHAGETQSAEDESQNGLLLPEEEEKRGMTIYLACIDDQIIGKVHLQLINGLGGIYGLGVLPEHRGKGLGRALLLAGVEKLKGSCAKEVMLQVVTENANALHLYQSSGFEITSAMEYFSVTPSCVFIRDQI